MVVYDPLEVLVNEALSSVSSALERNGVTDVRALLEARRTSKGFGDVTVLLFRVIKERGVKFKDIAHALQGLEKPEIFSEYKFEKGYVNFLVDVRRYAGIVFSSIEELGEKYGHVPDPSPKRVIVEHISANPIHPLHIGHLRNGILGDALARLLKSRGHDVKTHFYIDDVGLQVAYAAYGYSKVKDYLTGKPDHFIGDVYTMTNLMIELLKLKKQLSQADEKDRAKINEKIAKIMWKLNEYKEKRPEVFEKLLSHIESSSDPEKEIRDLNRAYERGELWALKIVRDMAKKCLEGFDITLEELDIKFDSWDWESELTVWNEATQNVIEKLSETGLVEKKDGALVFRADLLAEDQELRKKLKIPQTYQVTPMTLVRSDGTTLYTTRDIAYSIWKLGRADVVINVIAIQQTLAQIQLRLALYALGYRDVGERLIHYAYEMVMLPGKKMSSRRGVYVSADEIIEETVDRALTEIEKRKIGGKEEAKKIGIGALKFFFLNVSPQKPITFKWERVLDFEQNSGPFVQYAYVRARSILRKAEEQGLMEKKYSIEDIGEEEKNLVLLLGDFPSTVKFAADNLRPDIVTSYLNSLATEFNRYYDNYPVLKAPTREKRAVRLALVRMIAQVLKNGMYLLGIEPSEKM